MTRDGLTYHSTPPEGPAFGESRCQAEDGFEFDAFLWRSEGFEASSTLGKFKMENITILRAGCISSGLISEDNRMLFSSMQIRNGKLT